MNSVARLSAAEKVCLIASGTGGAADSGSGLGPEAPILGSVSSGCWLVTRVSDQATVTFSPCVAE